MAEFDFATAAKQLGGPPAAAEIDFAAEAKRLPDRVNTGGLSSLITGAPSITDDPAKSAGAGTIATASLANDPQARIRYFAQTRGIPEDRYSVIQGRIAYRGDDGNWYPEVPSGWSPSQLLKQIATGVGPSFPAVPGAAAGILTAPALLTGPPGLALSVGATGASAAAGQSVRELLADIIMGQPKSAMRVAGEGATAAAGQGVGAGLSAWAQRYAVPEAAKLNQPQISKDVASANRQGIDITPAEATNFSSLKAQQKYLGNAPATQDMLGDFYERRTGQVQDAAGKLLSGISPVDSAEVAGSMGQKAAQGAIDVAKESRRAAGAPVYSEVMSNPGNVIPREKFNALLTDEYLAPILKSALRNPLYDIPAGTPINHIQVVDAAKKILDDKIKEAVRAGADNKVRLLTQRVTMLRDMADEAIPARPATGGNPATPGYATARDIWAGKSPEVDALTDGMVGRIAETDRTQLGGVARSLFGANSGPVAIREAKDAISKADPAAWQALKRSWLQDVFEKSSTEYASQYGGAPNIAGKFFASTRGNMQTYARIKAALDPAELTAFNDLTDVLRMASRVKPIGSDTEFNRLISEAETAAARPLLAKLIRNANPAELLRNADTWITSRNLASNAEDAANIITNFAKNPDLTDQLRVLKQLSPTSIQFRVGLGHLLSQGTVAGASSALEPSQ